MTNFAGLLQAAAFSQKQHCFRITRGQQVHDDCRIRRADAEIHDRQTRFVGGGLHRSVNAYDGTLKLFREACDVVVKVCEQYVIAELIDGHAGIARQPFRGKLEFADHGLS